MYDKMIAGCVKRTSTHLYRTRCTFNLVLTRTDRRRGDGSGAR